MRRRAQLSCTECRRRKQKCNPRSEGACQNCVRRYPPVECVFLPDPRTRIVENDGLNCGGSGSILSDGPVAIATRRTLQVCLPDRSFDHAGAPAHSDLELEVASTLTTVLGVPSSVSNVEYERHLAEDRGSSSALAQEMVNANRSLAPTPIAFAGALTQINGMHGAYVPNSMRNAELWNFCKFSLAPLVSFSLLTYTKSMTLSSQTCAQ